MPGDAFQRLIDLAVQETGVEPARLERSTRLREDLGIDGDDGDEFLAAFAREFGVDMAACDPADYFAPEASWLLSNLILLLTDRRKLCRISLTLADLEGFGSSGVWFKPARAPVPLSPLQVLWIAATGLGALAILLLLLSAGLLLVVNFWA